VEDIPRTQPRDTTQGNAEEIPWTKPWDTAEDTLASTPVAVKMSPKEEGARDKEVPPRRDSGKKVLASQGTAEEIPRTQPRDTAQKTSASTQEGVKMLPKEKGARKQGRLSTAPVEKGPFSRRRSDKGPPESAGGRRYRSGRGCTGVQDRSAQRMHDASRRSKR
jgi:hypothetical protein